MTGSPLSRRENSACAVEAFGVIEAAAEDLVVLRRQPGLPNGLPTLPNLLNHAEDQTVAALTAVLRAIHDGQLQEQSFTDWGIIAAPRFPGRLAFATSLDKYRQLQSLSVSPLIIPFLSLHSVSSLLSLALHSQGPCCGVGGGSAGFMQALQLGLAMQQEQDLPGIWVVATGWDPEIVPGVAPAARPICRAAALALMPAATSTCSSHLRLLPRSTAPAKDLVASSLHDLVRFLTDAVATRQNRHWVSPLNEDWNLELTVNEAHISRFARSA